MKNSLKLILPFLLVLIGSNIRAQSNLEILAVGGGGGGGRNASSASSGGGGGGGGQVTGTTVTYAAGETYTITIGGGGNGYIPSGPTNPSAGSASTVVKSSTILTANGGGAGGNASSTSTAGNGGASGGSSGNGGRGGIKSPASNPVAGGTGSSTYSAWCSITGKGELVSSTYYLAGGGAGGNYEGIAGGSTAAAGAGGGGRSNTSGLANTGGGGGGANSNASSGYNITGGSGGSGLVILRYAGSSALATGGTITISGGYVYHTFTSGGTLVFNSMISAHPSTSTQNICINGAATALSVTATGTSITYQWYTNNSASNSGGTLISGATSSTYTPATTVTGTTYYYCYITNSTGNATSNVSGAIIINPPSVAGTVSGGNTITSGTNSTVLSVTGQTGSIQWQSSSNNTSFSDIGGQTGTTYTAVNLVSTTYYRAVITSGACASVNTNSTTVLVLPSTSPGSTTLSVSGTGTTISMTNNVATVIDNGLTVTSNGMISGFAVSITESYTNGDILTYTGTLPSGVTTSGFSSVSRSIVFSGDATAADWQALLRTVQLQTTAVTCNPESRAVSFTPSTNYYNYFNGHYYEFNPSGRSWTDARAYAASRTFFGRQGYLTTITSAAENAYITTLINQNTWIGCSDNYAQINGAVGYTKYANQTAAEGKWHWVGGPEKGIQIRTGNASTAEKAGSPVSGVYQNWNTTGSYASNEPNDVWSTSTPGQEDYGHVYANTGKWNDFPNGGRACIIEYGGMPGDVPVTTIAYTRNISITGSTSGRITGGGGTVCSGTNSSSLTLSGASGTVSRWEYSDDNFLSNISSISNTTTSYSAVNITATTYYRAIMVNGGCTLATTPVALYVTPLSSGSITANTNQVCVSSNTALTLNGYSGTVSKWQSSPDQVTITDITNTTGSLSQTMGSAGTYYFRAVVTNASCSNTANSEWYPVTVTSGSAPLGGTINSAAYCSASNSGVLTLSDATGSTYLWQVSTDNGSTWGSAGSTSTTLTYNNISQNKLYRVQVTNGSCGTTNSATGSIVIYGTTTCEWTGAIDNIWSKSGNWCAGVVGDNGRKVDINSLSVNDPILDASVSIDQLNFNASSRKVVLGVYNLTADAIIGADSLNYVKTDSTGVLRSTISNAEQFNFAIGRSAYNPVSITNNTGAQDVFSMRVYDAVYYQGYNGYPSTLPRINRTWDIFKTNANGGSGIDFLFNWNYAAAVNISLGHTLNHFESGAWTPQTTGTTTVVDNSLSYTGYTGTFSPFGIGMGLVPLPVRLFNFEAKAKHGKVTLDWTAQANETHTFDISRSTDGVNWVSIGKMNGALNSGGMNSYQFVDEDPLSTNLYKITMTGLETQKSESLIRSVNLNATSANVLVYPNPNNGSFTIETKGYDTYSIIDVNGRVVRSGGIDGLLSIQHLEIGLYSVLLQSDSLVEIVKVIVQ